MSLGNAPLQVAKHGSRAQESTPKRQPGVEGLGAAGLWGHFQAQSPWQPTNPGLLSKWHFNQPYLFLGESKMLL